MTFSKIESDSSFQRKYIIYYQKYIRLKKKNRELYSNSADISLIIRKSCKIGHQCKEKKKRMANGK